MFLAQAVVRLTILRISSLCLTTSCQLFPIKLAMGEYTKIG